MKTNLELAQDFAIGQCLSDYPPDASYQEICDWLDCDTRDDETDEPMVTPWQPFEYCDVVHIMDNMVSAVERLLHEHRGNTVQHDAKKLT
jgi:hypothetical protein